MIQVINKSEKNSDYFSLILEKLIIVLETNLALYIKNLNNKKKISDDIKTLIMFMYIIYFNIDNSHNIILFFKMNNYNILKTLKKAINIMIKN